MVKKIGLGFLLLSLAAAGCLLLVPAVNDSTAGEVLSALESCPLPPDTQLCGSVSAAGKLNGNGNGMQYFGAILLDSRLSLSELDAYYGQYRTDAWSYLVAPQDGARILMIEHQNISFDVQMDDTGASHYFIVYTWGSNDFPLRELDFRGY